MNYLTHYQTFDQFPIYTGKWNAYAIPAIVALGYVYYIEGVNGLEDIEEVRVWMN